MEHEKTMLITEETEGKRERQPKFSLVSSRDRLNSSQSIQNHASNDFLSLMQTFTKTTFPSLFTPTRAGNPLRFWETEK